MSRVLIVDGNESERARLVRELEAAGHAADDAPDGIEAFEKLLAGDCDVLVCEAELPRLGLPDLITRLRGRGLRTPVVVYTAVTRASAVAALMKLGLAAYLPKAGPPAALLQKLAELTAPAVAPPPPPACTTQVLVIDGAAEAHQQLAALFAGGAEGRASIKEGLHRARNGAFRLVLLDADAAAVNLGGAVAQIRVLLPEAAVVALARLPKGTAEAAIASSVAELGFDDVLFRPFQPEAVARLDEQYCTGWERLVELREDVVIVSALRRRADQRERYLTELTTRLEAALPPLSEACYEHAFIDLTRASRLLQVADAATLITALERAAAPLGIAVQVAVAPALARALAGIDESLDRRGFRWFTSVAAARDAVQAGTPMVKAAT